MSVLDDRPTVGHVSPGPDSGAAGLRVVFTAPPHIDGVLDGGWWPHASHLVDELLALLGAVQTRFGVVARASLSSTLWDAHPQDVVAGDRAVAVAWFRALDAPTVRLLGDFGYLNVLVIPPDTDAGAAATALAMVVRRQTVAAIHAILTSAFPAS